MICGHCQRQSTSILWNWPTRSGERSTAGKPPFRQPVRWGFHPSFRPNKARKRNGVRTPAEPRLKESRWQQSLQKYGRGWNQHASLQHEARRCLPMPANACGCLHDATPTSLGSGHGRRPTCGIAPKGLHVQQAEVGQTLLCYPNSSLSRVAVEAHLFVGERPIACRRGPFGLWNPGSCGL